MVNLECHAKILVVIISKTHENFSLRIKKIFSAQKMWSVKRERSLSICLFPFYYGLNICVSLNSYVEALIPNVLVFGSGALGR